ncbi:radical SAM family heme chaperone HemW [Ornithinimicrobium cryptoxanthini]|uniref:Heme chaperone HemW n=1 Tax=Ornithinimicrobium cryptoxanthini TaxID=2934161 RepID=A0ABY4YFT2_9MICO|nr:radical SAM family heme chaperone HemW [Ornithinimicrobium cryptoxanthini]USQ75110.1 radical SAM family heme chaperone HemW [Ornithinimicrobium cryptoxanthini]
MPSALPVGDPVPADGRLPQSAVVGLGQRPFGIYVHVPFCRVRCGYCDFNTYTVSELGGHGATVDTYADAALAELRIAREVLGEGAPPVATVFVGGGTPTMLPPQDLVTVLDGIREQFGLATGAEVTTEANPDTITPEVAQTLAAGGFTRVSLGMQSAVPHVLATLDRTHDPTNVRSAVAAVRAAGMQVSLDLIYGTPGESLADWRSSLEAVIDLAPDHVSAYALVVEEGTRLAAQVRRGQVTMPDDDDGADKYELAEQLLGGAGYGWYEISNWALSEENRCLHNVNYWRGADWWGIGPGAHSHVGGVRWWNVKHPAPYADRVAAGVSPGAGREVLTPEQRHDEAVLLGIRLVEGLDLIEVDGAGRTAVAGLIADGLIDGRAALAGRALLTVRGRLLADTVVHRLLAT